MDQNSDTSMNNGGNFAPMPTPAGVMKAETTPSLGPIIGVIIIVAVVIVGGLYYWSKQMIAKLPEPVVTEGATQTPQNNSVQAQVSSDPAIQQLKSQGTSDDIQSINQDLKATNLDNLGADLSDPNNAPQ